MESFFRVVAYVDYYENGSRVKNAGFLRWRIRHQEHRIELKVKDAGASGRCSIIEEKTGKRLGEIVLDQGEGSYLEVFRGRLIGKEKLCYDDIRAFKIVLDEGRYLRIAMELPRLAWEEARKDPVSNENTEGRSRQPKAETGTEPAPAADSRRMKLPAMPPLKSGQKQEITEAPQQPPAVRPLQEDKWKQLCNNYPTVHPFPNGKVFISLTPRDFVVLREEYQKLVHNSFLLHGYYNYRHMILGQLEDTEESTYYLGVPGVYYERERQAAQMFGFVGFEGIEEPVQNGSYGYYMIPVEI